MTTDNNIPCEKRKRVITRSDLPLCCPMPDERLWDGHPRVYLSLDDGHRAICPYCETEYELK